MKIYIFLILWAFISYANTSIFLESSYAQEYTIQSSDQMNEARLLSLYIARYKDRIIEAETIYPLLNPALLTKSYQDIDDMLRSLDQIMKNKYEKEEADTIMKNIVSYIKNLNLKLQKEIKIQEKADEQKLEIFKEKYRFTVWEIQKLLDKIIIIHTARLSKNKKDKNWYTKTQEIEKLKSEVRKIGDTRFVPNLTKIQLQAYLNQRIKNVREILKNLKAL